MSGELRKLMTEQKRLRAIVDEWLDKIVVPTDGGEIGYPPRTQQEAEAFLAAADALQRTEQAIADFFRHVRDPG